MLQFWNNLYCRWKRTSDNQKLIVERHDILSLRVKYPCAIRTYKEEGRLIVYAVETYIHSAHTTSYAWDDGSEAGLKARISKGRRLIIVHASPLVVICVVLLFLFSILFVPFYVLFVCECVLYYCHRVSTQLQLTNISYYNWTHCVNSKLSVIWNQWCWNCLILLLKFTTYHAAKQLGVCFYCC